MTTPHWPNDWAIGGDIETLEADVAALKIKTQYMHALIDGVHMGTDAGGLDALVALAGGATQAQANARAEALRTAILAHMTSVGTITAVGEHKAADTGNHDTLAAIAALTPSSLLAACITLVNGLNAAIVAHGDQSGVHFHDDATAAASTITTDPPTTLAHCITDLNDLLTTYSDHLALGSA